MLMTDLAARDAAERERMQVKAIEDIRRALAVAAERHARTDCLERRLALLLAARAA